ncbi:MAG: hypothetical protein OXI76_04925 [Gemmatimonadota bacterium]|nr:hypothetical protein [Gemmatimonadota bacterium]
MKWPWQRIVLALLLCNMATACRGTETGDEGTVEVPAFVGTIDLEIGQIDGDEPLVFGRIGSVVQDPERRLVVADRDAHELRVFDSDGRFAYRFGGAGDGPGELNSPCCLGFAPDGALWVREYIGFSYFRLGTTGATFEGEVRSSHSDGGLAVPVTFDAMGRLVDVASLPLSGGGSAEARLHMDMDSGLSVDTVWVTTPEEYEPVRAEVRRTIGTATLTMYVDQPFGPALLREHGPGGSWAKAISSEYLVTIHRPDNTVMEILGPPGPGPFLSDREQALAHDEIERDLRRIDGNNHPFDIPERKPPLRDLFFDQAGRLWVERTVADGAEMREADVYAAGVLVARYKWPARVNPGIAPWITESVLVGTTRDELGVQRVARVRFQRGVPE